MSDIQRWSIHAHPMSDPTGHYVTYADHVEALRQARAGFESEMQELSNYMENSAQERYRRGVEQGQRDALCSDCGGAGSGCRCEREAISGAVQRVEALPNAHRCAWCQSVIAAIKGGAE